MIALSDLLPKFLNPWPYLTDEREMRLWSILFLFFGSQISLANECSPDEFLSDFGIIVNELAPKTSVNIDVLTKGDQAGLVTFKMAKEFYPATKDRFDQIVSSLSSEQALNTIDRQLEVMRDPPLNIVIEAKSGAADREGKYKMVTETWIEVARKVTTKKSIMNCTVDHKGTSWHQGCEIDKTDPATTKYVSSGTRSMDCSLEQKKILCTTTFSAHPNDLDLPFFC